MHLAMLTMLMVAGTGSDRCLCLRIMAMACDPKPHRCCAPKYGCVPNGEICTSCQPGSSGHGIAPAYHYRSEIGYPWPRPKPAPPLPPSHHYWPADEVPVIDLDMVPSPETENAEPVPAEEIPLPELGPATGATPELGKTTSSAKAKRARRPVIEKAVVYPIPRR